MHESSIPSFSDVVFSISRLWATTALAFMTLYSSLVAGAAASPNFCITYISAKVEHGFCK
jgi:hypothetical protein